MNLVILTGAGISAESGVPTFRASDGLWCGHRVEDVATPEGYAADPALVQDFYNQRRRQLAEVEPNAAHRALADLAARWEGDFMPPDGWAFPHPPSAARSRGWRTGCRRGC